MTELLALAYVWQETMMKENNERIYEAGLEDGFHAAASAGISMPQRNKTAFVVGLISGLFGIWGLAHVLC